MFISLIKKNINVFDVIQTLHRVKTVYITNRKGKYLTVWYGNNTDNIEKYIKCRVLDIVILNDEDIELQIDRIRK